MKKSIIMIIAALSCNIAIVNSQTCEMYFPEKEGTIIQRKHFDKKDKLDKIEKQKILSKNVTGNVVTVGFETEMSDAKGKQESVAKGEVRCDNGVFYFDIKSMVDSKTMDSYKGTDVKVTASDLEMPSNLTAGQTLKDGNLTMKMNNPAMPMMNMSFNMRIYNRKVEAIESITTEAGTFTCAKISYDVEVKSFVTVKTKGIEWSAKNVGTVKQESYDQNGKLMGYSIISSIQ